MYELRSDMTIVIVTHNMQQAARVSDSTAFFLNGELVEMAPTNATSSPRHRTAHRSLHHRSLRMSDAIATLERPHRQFFRSRTRASRNDRCARLLLLLRREAGAVRHQPHDPRAHGDGVHRTIRMREIHAAPLDQPAQRAHPRRAAHGRNSARRAGHLHAGCRHRRAAAARRDGISALESVPEIDLRERRVRPAHQRHHLARRHSTR